MAAQEPSCPEEHSCTGTLHGQLNSGSGCTEPQLHRLEPAAYARPHVQCASCVLPPLSLSAYMQPVVWVTPVPGLCAWKLAQNSQATSCLFTAVKQSSSTHLTVSRMPELLCNVPFMLYHSHQPATNQATSYQPSNQQPTNQPTSFAEVPLKALPRELGAEATQAQQNNVTCKGLKATRSVTPKCNMGLGESSSSSSSSSSYTCLGEIRSQLGT